MEIVQAPLPLGWAWVTVKDIGEVVTGTTPTKKNVDYYGNYLPFVKPSDIPSNGLVIKAQENLSKLGAQYARVLPPKAVLVTSIGATIGKTGFAETAVSTNQQINSIIPFDNIVPEYIYYYCLSKGFRQLIRENSSATTIPIINKSRFEALPIPLAPYEEQKKIAKRINDLLLESDTVKHSLQKVPALLTNLRQSLLRSAYCGKLVSRQMDDYPIENTLNQIEKNRSEHGIYLDYTPVKENFFEIPYHWAWVRLGQVCHLRTDHVDPQKFPQKEFNYFSIENVESETGDLVNFKPTFGKDIHSSKLLFDERDVLYSKLRPYLNKIHVPLFEGISATDLIPLRAEAGIPREYIAFYLRSKHVVDYANMRTRGIQLPRLSTKDLLALPIPIAPPKEALEIVKKLKELWINLVSFRTELFGLNKKNGKVNDTILMKAFSGRLVPQDPLDEPSSLLLHRLKPIIVEKMAPQLEKNMENIERSSHGLVDLTREIIKENGQATVRQVYEASSLSIDDFWNELSKQITTGKIHEVRKSGSVFLEVK